MHRQEEEEVQRRSMSEGEARAEDFVTYSIAFFSFTGELKNQNS